MHNDDIGERQPTHFEALATTGALPIPPDAATIKDMGPLSDTPTAPLAPNQIDTSAEAVTEGESVSPLQASLKRLGRDRRAMICLAIVLMMIVIGYVGPFIYLHFGPTLLGGVTGTKPIPPSVYHTYFHQELTLQDLPPSGTYLLGTDQLGRDILARLMSGITVSIQVALLVEIVDIGLGVLIGSLAGFFGGWIDTFLARFTDVMFTFPGLLFAFIAVATLAPIFDKQFGPPGRLILISLALSIAIWPQMARFVRGQTLQLKEQQFVEAARTVGSSNSTIIISHIVPNLMSIVVAAATLNVVGTIVGEAVISLLGLGIKTPASSLGLMISDGIKVITTQPLEVIWPSLVLVILVLSLSFFGDGVRDAFDPRTKD